MTSDTFQTATRAREPLRPGILLINKRAGESSFSCVRAITDELASMSQRVPVSHAGALDPFAQGLLLILIGSATRLMETLHPVPKHYVAEIHWGSETDTGDPLGEVVAQGQAAVLSPWRLEHAIAEHLGWRDQIPPATSNKRVAGERAYVRAHRGEIVDLPPSRVYLHQARWRSHALPNSSTLELSCGGGFYVRSLARDLGRELGCRAHLAALERTAIGPWTAPPSEQRVLITGRALLPWLPRREVTDLEASVLRQGGRISHAPLLPPELELPIGYPATPGARALHRERLIAVLTEANDSWTNNVWLRGI